MSKESISSEPEDWSRRSLPFWKASSYWG